MSSRAGGGRLNDEVLVVTAELARENDCCLVSDGRFVVSGRYPAKAFAPVEAALDGVAAAVGLPVGPGWPAADATSNRWRFWSVFSGMVCAMSRLRREAWRPREL